MAEEIINQEEKNQPQRKEVSPEKLKALQVAMDKIDKTFGSGSIMKLGDDHIEDIDVIPTGRWAASRPSSMPSTPSTAPMPRLWA